MISRVIARASLYDVRLACVAALLVWAASAGCDRVALLGPINSTIQLTSSTRIVPTGGQAELTAVLLENSGSPVPNGTTVRFTTSLGRIDPAEAQTRNGIATAVFVAGNESGVAQIRAISGLASGGTTTTPGTGTGTGTTPTTTAANVVEITVGAAAANRIAVSASPSTVRTSGSSVEIRALVSDTNGNSLPNVAVSFSASRGNINPTVANTDGDGVARSTLTSSEASTVTARVGSGAEGRTATLEVLVAAVASFTLATTPASPSAGQPVSLTITPAANTAPRVTVNWGDATAAQDIGVVSAARAITHTYVAPGFYTIEATGTTPDSDTFTNAIPVTVAQQPPVELRVTPTTGNVGTQFTFTITPTTGALIANVTIDYGDTTTEDFGALSTERTVTHSYNSLGNKTVTVTQTEVNGRITRAIVTVSVTN